MATNLEVWLHNVSVLDLNNMAAFYSVGQAIDNANHSAGEEVLGGSSPVTASPRNEAWYEIANSTLGSIADDWGSYIDVPDNGTKREWAEFVEEYERWAL